jgi:hypothetical protein
MRTIGHNLTDFGYLDRFYHLQGRIFPTVAFHIGIALLGIQEAHKPHARHRQLVGQCLQGRNADQGNIQHIAHGLCRRKTYAQACKRTGAIAYGNAGQIFFRYSCHFQHLFNMRQQGFRMRELPLHGKLGQKPPLISHGYA